MREKILILLIAAPLFIAASYRQKLPTVEAIQWTCDNIGAVIAFVAPATLTRIDPARPGAANMIGVPAVQGVIACDCKGAPGTDGDWILKRGAALGVETNAAFTAVWEPAP